MHACPSTDMASALRRKYAYLPPDQAVDFLVIGAGVVGVAIARQLSLSIADKSTFLVERYASQLPWRYCSGKADCLITIKTFSSWTRDEQSWLMGDTLWYMRFTSSLTCAVTSSRNSEVVHAGIYYPRDSLKTLLCIQGRKRLYEYCQKHDIPHRKTQKLVVAVSDSQQKHLEQLYRHATNLPNPPGSVPVRLISGREAKELEPDLSDDVCGALLSPETGIIDAHSLIERMETEMEENGETGTVYGTSVVRIDKSTDDGRGAKGKRGDSGNAGWVVQTENENGERSAILARCVINSAGLNAHNIVNQVLPESQRKSLYFCKGSYFSYRGPGVSQVKHLIYPCPEPGLAGLGTHLTMNLANEIRFGPDVEWLKAPEDLDEEQPDFWTKMLEPNESRHDEVFEAVKRYLPGVQRDSFAPDYSGIRPKLQPSSQTPEDFTIQHIAPGFINLMGIESPGLTSSMAIASYVEQMIRRQVLGLGVGRGRNISNVGSLEDWG